MISKALPYQDGKVQGPEGRSGSLASSDAKGHRPDRMKARRHIVFTPDSSDSQLTGDSARRIHHFPD